jgi:hypothetical protein
MKNISYSSGKCGTFIRIFGFTLAVNPFGNCFSPAIIINTRGLVGIASFTLRTRHSLETTVYVRSLFKWDWNSGHLARWFGTYTECPWGDYYNWRGHNDI